MTTALSLRDCMDFLLLDGGCLDVTPHVLVGEDIAIGAMEGDVLSSEERDEKLLEHSISEELLNNEDAKFGIPHV